MLKVDLHAHGSSIPIINHFQRIISLKDRETKNQPDINGKMQKQHNMFAFLLTVSNQMRHEMSGGLRLRDHVTLVSSTDWRTCTSSLHHRTTLIIRNVTIYEFRKAHLILILQTNSILEGNIRPSFCVLASTSPHPGLILSQP